MCRFTLVVFLQQCVLGVVSPGICVTGDGGAGLCISV